MDMKVTTDEAPISGVTCKRKADIETRIKNLNSYSDAYIEETITDVIAYHPHFIPSAINQLVQSKTPKALELIYKIAQNKPERTPLALNAYKESQNPYAPYYVYELIQRQFSLGQTTYVSKAISTLKAINTAESAQRLQNLGAYIFSRNPQFLSEVTQTLSEMGEKNRVISLIKDFFTAATSETELRKKLVVEERNKKLETLDLFKLIDEQQLLGFKSDLKYSYMEAVNLAPPDTESVADRLDRNMKEAIASIIVKDNSSVDIKFWEQTFTDKTTLKGIDRQTESEIRTKIETLDPDIKLHLGIYFAHAINIANSENTDVKARLEEIREYAFKETKSILKLIA